MKSNRVMAAVLIVLLLCGCDSSTKAIYKVALASVELGYDCAENGKSKDDCIADLNSAIIEAAL